MTDYPSNYNTYTFKVVVVEPLDPCRNTVLYAPDTLPDNMETSVKVQASGGPFIKTQ